MPVMEGDLDENWTMINLMCAYHIKCFRRDGEQSRNRFDTLVDSNDEVGGDE